jgi:hypothetical protein
MLAAAHYIHGSLDLTLEFRVLLGKGASTEYMHAHIEYLDMAGVQDTGEVILVCAGSLIALSNIVAS